jgi:hypothetical protein
MGAEHIVTTIRADIMRVASIRILSQRLITKKS